MDPIHAFRRLPLLAAVLMVCLLLGACATLPRTPVPADQIAWAVVPGMPDVRAWAGRPNRDMEEDFEQSIRDERTE